MENHLTAQTEAAKLFWNHHAIIRESDIREYLTSKEKNELAHKSAVVSLELLEDGEHKKMVRQYLDDMPDCVYFK